MEECARQTVAAAALVSSLNENFAALALNGAGGEIFVVVFYDHGSVAQRAIAPPYPVRAPGIGTLPYQTGKSRL